MTMFSIYQLDHVKTIAENIGDVSVLRAKKAKAIENFTKNDRLGTPKPVLKPDGDTHLQIPEYSNPPGNRNFADHEQDIENYNDQIREAVRKDFYENQYDDELTIIDEIDVVQLMEEGSAYVHARQEIETQLKTSLDFDNDISLSQDSIHRSYEENKGDVLHGDQRDD